MDLRGILTVHGFRVQRFRVQRSEVRGQRFTVQSSTVKVVKVYDFESNTEFIRALKSDERACTEIKSKNMIKS